MRSYILVAGLVLTSAVLIDVAKADSPQPSSVVPVERRSRVQWQMSRTGTTRIYRRVQATQTAPPREAERVFSIAGYADLAAFARAILFGGPLPPEHADSEYD